MVRSNLRRGCGGIIEPPLKILYLNFGHKKGDEKFEIHVCLADLKLELRQAESSGLTPDSRTQRVIENPLRFHQLDETGETIEGQTQDESRGSR